jgi:hypothetical protein
MPGFQFVIISTLIQMITEESDPHPEKHPSPKTSTDGGRMISIKPVLKNVNLSIRDNLDPDPNDNRGK